MSKSKQAQMKELFERSGSYKTDDYLVGFLYELMRDHVSPGVIEHILQSDLEGGTPGAHALTNGWLAKYAEDVAKRIRENT